MWQGIPSHHCAKGFTLIELMIALVLGLLISAAAIELFTGSLLSSRMQQANDELQSSGIFGLDYIVRDIRLANYANINKLDYLTK